MSHVALDRSELFGHYDRCLSEYRSQLELNRQRTQYFFVLNTAVVSAGLSLLALQNQARGAIAGIFVVGVALSMLAIVAVRTQHGYYREGRDLVKNIADELGLGTLAIRTTPGLGSARPRFARVHALEQGMFILIALIDAIGIAVSVF